MNQNNIPVHLRTRGGARPGSGRPKGSSNKIKLEDLMSSLEQQLGVPYADQIAKNYVDALTRQDWDKVEKYDKTLLNKLVADKTEVTVEEIGDTVVTREAMFREALESLININKTKD